MDAARLRIVAQCFLDLYDYVVGKTTWDHMIGYIIEHYYTKQETLRRNNWGIIGVLREYGLLTVDQLIEAVEFFK
jgi:hypothetical protein